ncbi:uncharacterized protein N7473_003386 [Penicillium subrubescens]|uniref:uncharacterized protein n=1 Tax=Penicillium subrubescens TaxID=1316194 RepID=UPI0025453C7D|nr:uncharacterized protein N7473_003386 [Penicillium subrubescens]KAJ5906470.1 hypothetical protein N7473_003386 [Penicillium subrubescens]
MSDLAPFALPQWIESKKDNIKLPLAGSATPGLSIQDLINLSTDKQTTTSNLSFQHLKLTLGPFDGSQALRKSIAALYNDSITAENIFPTHGTTGANALLFQSLLKAGDHVIAMYPCYTQLISLPKSIPGVEVDYWELDLDLENGAKADIQALRGLIRPTTKMIVLNNPNNPLGTVLSRMTQNGIVEIAREYGLTILVDEIFRPLFHDSNNQTDIPPSFIDLPPPHAYENIIVTSSMSKAWGLSGTRVGWLATRSTSILSTCFNRGLYTIMALGSIDEAIAAEALSDRCRPQILNKHLAIARTNIALIEEFVGKNRDVCGWVRPSAGGTGFVRVYQKEKGEGDERVPVDDVVFCRRLRGGEGGFVGAGESLFWSA